MIKTINLTGTEIKVTELGGDNTEIFNNGDNTVYASKLPNITPGGDNVIAIPAGAIDGLYGTHGTVYLLSEGEVELRGGDQPVTKSRGTGISPGVLSRKCAETLDVANAHADALNADLSGYVGYTDEDIYGLEADFENSVFTRLAGAVGKTAGADFDSVRAYGGRRRCNLSDSGEVLAYYGDENFRADGSNGQVMVEQPRFYYKVVPLKTEKIDGADGHHLRKARYYISDMPKAGFKVHPAFVRNGVEVDRIYLSAFEGCVYDSSAEAYLLNDEQIADFNSDKLSSIAGAKPCSGQLQLLTRTNARKLAHNRGNGWEQATIQAVAATQLLFVIEYATFNSQSAIGLGAVSKPVGSTVNSAEKTGATLALENSSGTIDNSNGVQFVSYRGEENIWGNLSTFIDGIFGSKMPESSFAKVSIQECDFSDDFSDIKAKLYTPRGEGYISAFGYCSEIDWIFCASEIKGNSSLPVGDMFWSSISSNFIMLIPGETFEKQKGMFATNANWGITYHTFTLGTRLVFLP